MRFTNRRRILPKLAPHEHSIFHCVSRIVDRRFIFGPKEKAQFLLLLRRYERFCCIRILGYCLMDNHFHLLLHIPGRPELRPSQEELMEHVQKTLGKTASLHYQERIDFWQALVSGSPNGQNDQNDQIAEFPTEMIKLIVPPGLSLVEHAKCELEKITQDIWQRMYDLSRFVLSVKQRFSQWFNQENDRKGTLWEDRFQAVLVQPGTAVAELAAYIDLNPVRAGIVADAKDYPWSQYGAAVAGDGLAQQALEFLVNQHLAQQKARITQPENRVEDRIPHAPLIGLQLGLAAIGMLLDERAQRPGDAEREKGEDDAAKSLPLPRISYVAGAVPAFTKGMAIGDPVYLESVFAEHRRLFGFRRQRGAKRILWPHGKGSGLRSDGRRRVGGDAFTSGASRASQLGALREIRRNNPVSKPRFGSSDPDAACFGD